MQQIQILKQVLFLHVVQVIMEQEKYSMKEMQVPIVVVIMMHYVLMHGLMEVQVQVV